MLDRLEELLRELIVLLEDNEPARASGVLDAARKVRSYAEDRMNRMRPVIGDWEPGRPRESTPPP